ncbi:MAG: hypothetical protein AAGB31_11180 [Bdellovibrio sp.]
MSSFVNEFKKYQRQERLLTGAMVLLTILAPVSFSWLVERKIHWIISALVGVFFLALAAGLHMVRSRVASKVLKKYETLDVGAVLAKKLSSKQSHRFVVVNRGCNHYYLKSLSTGEQVLVSKNRVKEDFDIAN